MKRALAAAAVLVGVQALLLLGYWMTRDEAPAQVSAERLERPAPELVYRSPDGEEHRLTAQAGEPIVLHFWATWCGPCREELPALLSFAGAQEIRVLAVSVDPDWPEVRRFLGGAPPPPVVLASGKAAERDFGVTSLPQTFVVDAGGTLRLRFDGPRDWSDSAVRAAVLEAGGD